MAAEFTQTVEPIRDIDAVSSISVSNIVGEANVDIEVLKHLPKDFAIDCVDHANWLIRKIIEARAYGERVKAWAEQEQHRAAREEQTLMFLFGRQLEAWATAEIDKLGGKRKSLALPAGIVGFRRIAAKLVVDDETAVIAWARQNCQTAVTHIEKLSKAALDTYVQSTGSIPEFGAHIEPDSDRFFIK